MTYRIFLMDEQGRYLLPVADNDLPGYVETEKVAQTIEVMREISANGGYHYNDDCEWETHTVASLAICENGYWLPDSDIAWLMSQLDKGTGI